MEDPKNFKAEKTKYHAMNLQRSVTHKTTTFPSQHSTSNQEQGSCSSLSHFTKALNGF